MNGSEVETDIKPFQKVPSKNSVSSDFERLKAEEIYLLQLKNSLNYEILRPPKNHWYALVDETFHRECRKTI